MWRRGFILVTIVAASLHGPPALAQTYCGKRADVLTQLAQQFGEVPGAIALTDQGSLLEVLVSPAGSWTILVTAPAGPSCIVATGKQWETLPALADGPGV